MSDLRKELCRMVNIKKISTIQYQLQTDRIVKEFNEELVRRLLLYVSANQWDWDEHINTVLFAYRTAINLSRREYPYFLLYGRETFLHSDFTLQNINNVPISVEN